MADSTEQNLNRRRKSKRRMRRKDYANLSSADPQNQNSESPIAMDIDASNSSIRVNDAKIKDPDTNGKHKHVKDDTLEAKNKRSKRRAKKKGSNTILDPAKVVETILSNSSYKVPNLSEKIIEIFNSEPKKSQIKNELKDLLYLSTVGENGYQSSDVEMTMLPFGIEGSVNVPHFAITEMSCINGVIKKRFNRDSEFKKRRLQKKAAKAETNKNNHQKNGNNQHPSQKSHQRGPKGSDITMQT